MQRVAVGFLGFGNIGSGVFRILRDNGGEIAQREGIELYLKKALVRDVTRKRLEGVASSVFTTSPRDIIDDPEIMIVAEFLGGVEPARSYILEALRKGKTVVTANKEVVAKHWEEFDRTARENGAGMYFEASVAGGIPIIKVMGESLQANRIKEVMGIINGTTNYILTRMADENMDFEEVLREAQQLGYAEPNPAADVEGFDAAFKLSILSTMAFHAKIPVAGIFREGISRITVEDINYGRELGYTLKLLAIAKKNDGAVEARVHPTFIPSTHPLASVRDVYNAVFIKGDAIGNLMLYGRGAGDLPTGSAIVSDMITAVKNLSNHSYPAFGPERQKIQDNWETGYFVRLTVKDKPGVLAKIAGIFGNHEVSIASVIQKDHNNDVVPLIFVIHRTKEQSMKDSIVEITGIPEVVRVENVIRVER